MTGRQANNSFPHDGKLGAFPGGHRRAWCNLTGVAPTETNPYRNYDTSTTVSLQMGEDPTPCISPIESCRCALFSWTGHSC